MLVAPFNEIALNGRRMPVLSGESLTLCRRQSHILQAGWFGGPFIDQNTSHRRPTVRYTMYEWPGDPTSICPRLTKTFVRHGMIEQPQSTSVPRPQVV